VSPVKCELGFYILQDDILIVTAVKTSNLTTAHMLHVQHNNLICNKQPTSSSSVREIGFPYRDASVAYGQNRAVLSKKMCLRLLLGCFN
jgi:hypothetical protein